MFLWRNKKSISTFFVEKKKQQQLEMCPQYRDAPAVWYLTIKLQNSTWYKYLNLSLTGSLTYVCKYICMENLKTLFVLRFYGPVNQMGSCRARSVYLTTRLLGRRLTSIVHILSTETDNCPS